ncbi:hypothetical protein [[Pseudopropionibacterium] massiliense]|uniref:hypothetical protein n=1 Tax=[Pseudopropionibacterium] massiliense TaxID=2220000 RepID=UPI00103126A7|nr:hypothetical protein [[Pseudopropionibacterium] massiliense]
MTTIDREIPGPPRRMHPDPDQESPSRRRRLPRWVTVPALVVALLFGSWAASHLPTSESVRNAPFFRAGMMDQSVELRMGSVKVTRVRSATEVQSGPDVAKTSGIWLVVDVDFTPKDEPHSLLTPQLSDSQGRDFGDFQAITVPPCGPGQPGMVLGCTFALELPTDALQGAVLLLFLEKTLLTSAPFDVASIDLGIDESRAEQLAAGTGRITVDPPRVKGKA